MSQDKDFLDSENDKIAEVFSTWLRENDNKFNNLKDAVVSIIKNLLTVSNIDFLAVSGRTKDFESAMEKVRRKGYDDPQNQMTDLTGIRVIVYLESDVLNVAEIIRSAFNVDEDNSSNTDDRLSTNQVGYRSVHFVCDLGKQRTELPEFTVLKSLKFEFQVRTVLQHAWAELAHERNYKFSGKLPRHLERRMFLLAGLLETADQGFDDLSKSFDNYVSSIEKDANKGVLSTELNSISLEGFINQWALDNGITIKQTNSKRVNTAMLVRELSEYGINDISELNDLISNNKSRGKLGVDAPVTIYGLIRRCMIINDPERFIEKVNFNWSIGQPTKNAIESAFGDKAEDIIERIMKKKGNGSRL